MSHVTSNISWLYHFILIMLSSPVESVKSLLFKVSNQGEVQINQMSHIRSKNGFGGIEGNDPNLFLRTFYAGFSNQFNYELNSSINSNQFQIFQIFFKHLVFDYHRPLFSFFISYFMNKHQVYINQFAARRVFIQRNRKKKNLRLLFVGQVTIDPVRTLYPPILVPYHQSSRFS